MRSAELGRLRNTVTIKYMIKISTNFAEILNTLSKSALIGIFRLQNKYIINIIQQLRIAIQNPEVSGTHFSLGKVAVSGMHKSKYTKCII